jgi:hypothetical protein
MHQTKVGNRFVVIARPTLAGEKAGPRPPAVLRPTARRLVVIRDGEVVASRAGR